MTMPLQCADVRERLVDYQRGLLRAEIAGDVSAHLEGCAACAHEDVVEQALTDVLERRLPQHAAPLALKRRLASQWPAPAPADLRAPRRWWARGTRALVPAAAVVLVAIGAVAAYYRLLPALVAAVAPAAGPATMIAEAVNDHLRVLSSQNPLEIKSGGMHQVKPWFAGRLDFTPVVRFAGDQEFQLDGGAVGYFLDRRAAVLVFRRRLHVMTLFVFRADGLPWPSRGLEPVGQVRAYGAAERGFNVVLWREGELGYALVSDVNREDLRALTARLTAPD